MRKMIKKGANATEITKRRRSLEAQHDDDAERREVASACLARFFRRAAGLCTGRIPPTPEVVKVAMALHRARARAARAAQAREAATTKRDAAVRRYSQTTDDEDDGMAAAIARLAMDEASKAIEVVAPPLAPEGGAGAAPAADGE